MSCTIEKILTDAKTLLERLREHDAAAESLVDQSAALHRRVAAMREAGTALPDQVRQRVWARALGFWALEGWRMRSSGNSAWSFFLAPEGGCETFLWGRGCQCCPGVLPPTSPVVSAAVLFTARLVCLLFVQYQEDASDIKDMSKYKPHILLSQENTQIRDLQQENRG